jgi:hypothetical protein
MSAGHQQGDERELGWFGFQHGRQQVSLHVMHGNGRATQRQRQRPARRGADQQGADQPGAGRVGHAVDVGPGNSGLGQAGIRQRQQFAHVVAGGDLGNDAAVFRVQGNLAV